MRGSRIKRLVAALGIATLVAGGTVALGANPASADSSGCTFTSSSLKSYVCIAIKGSGTYVSHVSVSRGKFEPVSANAICNYQGLMNVWNSSGTLIDHRWSPFHSGCSYFRAWFDWYPNKSYPNNSSMCTYFYEGYGHLQGVACKKIHS
jgi:hypothetical protein